MLQRFARTPLLVAAIATVLASMAGCSGDDARIYDIYKCAHVATILRRQAEASAAIAKAKPLLEQKKGHPAEYMMPLKDKLTDDLALYRLSPMGQAQKINDVYESSTCQKLYQ